MREKCEDVCIFFRLCGMMFVDYRFVFKVVYFMLPKPRVRVGPFEGDRAESLGELGILSDGYFAC